MKRGCRRAGRTAGIVKIRAEMYNAAGVRLMTIVSNGLMSPACAASDAPA